MIRLDFDAVPVAECYDCRIPYDEAEGFADLVIEDSAWRAISPDGEGNGLLCPNCIIARLHKGNIRTVGTFASGPIDSVPYGEWHASTLPPEPE